MVLYPDPSGLQRHFLRLCYLIVFSLLLSGGCKKEEPERIFPPAGSLISPMDAGDKIKFLKDILREDPKNLNALIKLGNIMMDTKQFKEAIDAYEKALKIEPKNVDVRVDLGTCYRYVGMPNKAVEEYRKAITINPKHPYAHKNLGVVLIYDLGDTSGGIKELELYLSLSPRDPDTTEIKKEIERLRLKGKKG